MAELFDTRVVRLGIAKARAKRKLKEAMDEADAALESKDAPRAERLLAIGRALQGHIDELAKLIKDDDGSDLPGEEKHESTRRGSPNNETPAPR
jgi:hypothetical protein